MGSQISRGGCALPLPVPITPHMYGSFITPIEPAKEEERYAPGQAAAAKKRRETGQSASSTATCVVCTATAPPSVPICGVVTGDQRSSVSVAYVLPTPLPRARRACMVLVVTEPTWPGLRRRSG
jgi:hypothetical protein